MPFKLLRDGIDSLAKRAGYIPVAEMKAALAAKDAVEQELRHKTRNLEHQIFCRDRLEKELAWLKELQLAHANRESGTQRAVAHLDRITTNLLDMMKDVWPDALHLANEGNQDDTTVEVDRLD